MLSQVTEGIQANCHCLQQISDFYNEKILIYIAPYEYMAWYLSAETIFKLLVISSEGFDLIPPFQKPSTMNKILSLNCTFVWTAKIGSFSLRARGVFM
jgi:hypothetical protein